MTILVNTQLANRDVSLADVTFRLQVAWRRTWRRWMPTRPLHLEVNFAVGCSSARLFVCVCVRVKKSSSTHTGGARIRRRDKDTTTVTLNNPARHSSFMRNYWTPALKREVSLRTDTGLKSLQMVWFQTSSVFCNHTLPPAPPPSPKTLMKPVYYAWSGIIYQYHGFTVYRTQTAF